MSEGERCHDCGRPYELVWTAPDWLWRLVTGWGEGGLLCPDCFHVRCKARGMFVRFVPRMELKS